MLWANLSGEECFHGHRLAAGTELDTFWTPEETQLAHCSGLASFSSLTIARVLLTLLWGRLRFACVLYSVRGLCDPAITMQGQAAASTAELCPGLPAIFVHAARQASLAHLAAAGSAWQASTGLGTAQSLAPVLASLDAELAAAGSMKGSNTPSSTASRKKSPSSRKRPRSGSQKGAPAQRHKPAELTSPPLQHGPSSSSAAFLAARSENCKVLSRLPQDALARIALEADALDVHCIAAVPCPAQQWRYKSISVRNKPRSHVGVIVSFRYLPKCAMESGWGRALAAAVESHTEYMGALLLSWLWFSVLKLNPLIMCPHTSLLQTVRKAFSAGAREVPAQPPSITTVYANFPFPSMHRHWLKPHPTHPLQQPPTWVGPDFLALGYLARLLGMAITSPSVLRLALSAALVADAVHGTNISGSAVREAFEQARRGKNTFTETTPHDIHDFVAHLPWRTTPPAQAWKVNRALLLGQRAPKRRMPHKIVVHPRLHGVLCWQTDRVHPAFGTFTLDSHALKHCQGLLPDQSSFNSDIAAAVYREYCMQVHAARGTAAFRPDTVNLSFLYPPGSKKGALGDLEKWNIPVVMKFLSSHPRVILTSDNFQYMAEQARKWHEANQQKSPASALGQPHASAAAQSDASSSPVAAGAGMGTAGGGVSTGVPSVQGDGDSHSLRAGGASALSAGGTGAGNGLSAARQEPGGKPAGDPSSSDAALPRQPVTTITLPPALGM